MAQELKTTPRQVPRTLDSGERTRAKPILVPRTDIYETRDAIILLAEMPGVTPDGVNITLEKRVLTLHGHTADPEPQGYRQVYAEYGDGAYERVFTLSEDVDRERIEATLSAGVLRLVLPKAEAAKAQKIQVTSA